MAEPSAKEPEKIERQDELAMGSQPNPLVTLAVAIGEFNYNFWMMGMTPSSHYVQKSWWS